MNTKRKLLLPVLLVTGCWLCPITATPQSVAPCITLICPPGVTNECTSRDGTLVNFPAVARSLCDRVVRVTCVPPSGSLFPPGNTRVTCVATDDADHTARCEFTVTITDTTPPRIFAPEAVSAHCTGPDGAPVSYEVSFTDNCDAPTAVRFTCTPPSGSLFPVGTTSVQCVAIDARNNRSTATFPVTVTGDCAPDCLQIDCPRSQQLAVQAGIGRVVTFAVNATNRCGGYSVPVFCQPFSGSVFPLGTTTVHCSATNAGAIQKCSFEVTILDQTPPSLRMPSTIVANCQGFGFRAGPGATITYPVVAKDNSDPFTRVECTPPSGSWFHLGTNVVTCTATDTSGNMASNQFLVVVKSGPACEVTVPVTELAPDNWGFELGMVGWIPSGGAFANQPVVGEAFRVKRIPGLKQQMDEQIGGGYWQDLTYRIGFQGQNWIGTADNYTVPQGGFFDTEQPDDTLTGELLSKPFVITKPYISFLIGGGADPDRLRVELLVEAPAGAPDSIQIGLDTYVVETSATGHDRELLRRAAWGTDSFGHHVLGKKARIRIVDHSSAGHINVDDFQFVETHPHFQKVKIGGSEFPAVVLFDGHEYDWDSPVWGMVDLHAHPMSYLGFAEGVMHGMPDGGAADPTNIGLALPDCNCLHGGWDLFNNQCGNYLRQALQMGTDSLGNDSHREGWSSDRILENGVPNEYGRFRHWPVFSTKTHQQMWYEWIKRAYDGGLRTMVALCVNNGLLGSASEGPGPIDDLTVGDHQIQAMKEFVARHDDFLEIAYDPFQLRDIVRRNKLAIVLGSELDDIGNLIRNPAVNAFRLQGAGDLDAYSKQAVTNAVHHMYTNGVRYIFPVHLVNNKFGGTPIADLMLNIANRFMNGSPLYVEPAEPGDQIHFWLPEDFDLGVMIADHKDELTAGAIALPLVLPLLPALADIFGLPAGVPPGASSAVGAGLLPVALLAAVGALPSTLQAIPPDVWPINQHYPHYPGKGPGEAPWGHRNQRGLTDLGDFALREMMRRGMMIDVDHMSQKTLNAVFSIAEKNPVGYPLNSGHNNFRALAGAESAENNRSGEQMNHIRDLGGLFGVGYENCDTSSLEEVWVRERNFSTSHVDNDCGGTSKTVSQIYLFALEAMNGHRVGLGTDVDGFIPGPGPRFGPNADFGHHGPWDKPGRIRDQDNGVLYTPRHGRPIVGPAFSGEGVDPEKEYGFGSHEHYDDKLSLKPGRAYSQEQRDFFPAIRIFHFIESKVSGNGWTESQAASEIDKITRMLDGGYNNGRVANFAFGLVKGIKGWSPDGWDQLVARLVYQEEIIGSAVPDFIEPGSGGHETLFALRGVWYDYHHIFGKNPPLKRCQTGPKDWDINFEGVAHYGMLPDLFQDMVNVGMEVTDLNPLFQSSEDFAGMWTKTLRAADALVHPLLYLSATPTVVDGTLHLVWYAEPNDVLEETTELGPNAVWHPTRADFQYEGGLTKATLRIDPRLPRRFYRVRK